MDNTPMIGQRRVRTKLFLVVISAITIPIVGVLTYMVVDKVEAWQIERRSLLTESASLAHERIEREISLADNFAETIIQNGIIFRAFHSQFFVRAAEGQLATLAKYLSFVSGATTVALSGGFVAAYPTGLILAPLDDVLDLKNHSGIKMIESEEFFDKHIDYVKNERPAFASGKFRDKRLLLISRPILDIKFDAIGYLLIYAPVEKIHDLAQTIVPPNISLEFAVSPAISESEDSVRIIKLSQMELYLRAEDNERVTFARIWEAFWRTILIAIVAILASSLLGFIVAHRLFTIHSRWRAEQAKTRESLLRAKAQAELDVLRSQMNPHFIFNSLNSIAVLAARDVEKTRDVIEDLSQVFRSILVASKDQVVPLSVEIDLVKKYLSIEKVRFNERLSYSFEIPENAKSVFIPGLILQTLVENAIKHGIARLRSGGHIGVEIARDDASGWYLATITNHAPKAAAKASPTASASTTGKTSIGLRNSIERLDLLYGPQHNFETVIADGTATVTFRFSGQPFDRQDSNR